MIRECAFMTYLHTFQDNDPKSKYLLPATLKAFYLYYTTTTVGKQDWENFVNILGLVEPVIKV